MTPHQGQVHLLDANVLIAAVVPNHVHHPTVTQWLAPARHVATCPITEGALVRFLLREGSTGTTAERVLQRLADHANVEFWPDAVSFNEVDLRSLHGHRQVTDAYLAALTRSRAGARLATLDRALATRCSDVCDLLNG